VMVIDPTTVFDNVRQSTVLCFLLTLNITMVQAIISGTSNCQIRYFSGLSHSCVSLAFWSAHQVLSRDATPTVSYCVTIPTTELLFTTSLGFYVCEHLDFDVVLGQDFNQYCENSSGEPLFSFFFFLLY